MAETGENVVEQSEVLSTEEVAQVVNDTPTEEPEVVLQSDKVEFEVPEKFKGKSAEDVIKSYMELEKLKGGEPESTEGEKPSEPEEGKQEEPTKVEEEQYQKYADALDKDGKLSTADYEELAKAGYDKSTVDAEIKNRADRQEFETYKNDRALNSILEPLGGGKEKFEEVGKWFNGEKSEAEVKAFNAELAASGPIAKQALLKSMYSDYEAAGKAVDDVLHTNAPQSRPGRGYTTQEEFFKDVGSEEYQNNAAYRKAVESEMAKSGDLF